MDRRSMVSGVSLLLIRVSPSSSFPPLGGTPRLLHEAAILGPAGFAALSSMRIVRSCRFLVKLAGRKDALWMIGDDTALWLEKVCRLLLSKPEDLLSQLDFRPYRTALRAEQREPIILEIIG